ncbi:hypothetical protein Pla8534_70890 [Lignipirellula cremea]|uniref:Glycosyltransferase RgtA/B/C/D-like domain-containing protein n=1 Tax=Lignipirellula cremea TaxID=2528010 RepID=A0A518E512_9BACT|nr:hypothetical protein Pla8534_70890 [Lignipirellula cremea]
MPLWELAVVLITALLLRGAVLYALWDRLADDPDLYQELAGNLVEHGQFARRIDGVLVPTAFRPPLYPLMLACLGGGESMLAVACLHLALGAATAAGVWLLARWAGLGRWSLLAAGLTICDPILLNQSSLVMTETLAVLLATAALVLLTAYERRPHTGTALLTGAVLGLACLCRPTFLPWLLLIPPMMWLVQGGRDGRSRFSWAACRGPLLLLVGAAVLLSPWAMRNAVLFGKPIVGTTHGGYTLWLSNNRAFYDYLEEHPPGALFDAERELPSLSAPDDPPPGPQRELVHDGRANAWARQAIFAEPDRFAWSCLVRVGRLWLPLPHATTPQESTARRLARYAVGGWYVLLYLAAGVGLLRWRADGRRAPWLWGLLLCFCLTAVHTLYFSNLRMRAPATAVLCLAAAAALSRRQPGASGVTRAHT